jgi:hypothetical protein
MRDFSPLDEIFKVFSRHMQPKFVVTPVGFIKRELLPFTFVDLSGAIDEFRRISFPRDNQVLGHLNARRFLAMCFMMPSTPILAHIGPESSENATAQQLKGVRTARLNKDALNPQGLTRCQSHRSSVNRKHVRQYDERSGRVQLLLE